MFCDLKRFYFRLKKKNKLAVTASLYKRVSCRLSIIALQMRKSRQVGGAGRLSPVTEGPSSLMMVDGGRPLDID